jgi:Holliday junction DNA helicase RuvA
MIAAIRGEIVDIAEDSLVVFISGIGFRIFVPKHIHAQAHRGDSIYLHTYLVVRQDALILFGFEKEAEREFFTLLLGVNGIGPRLALSILSTLSLDIMRQAVLSEQADAFSRVPGVGKKTAQKIILHLQGRIGGELPAGIPPVSDVDGEVINALISLGYSVVEAQAAIQYIPRDSPKDLETRLRLALQYFTK